MKQYGLALVAVVLGGCNGLTVREATLSNQQKVAMVSTAGDGVSPPATLVLLESERGQYAPVSTGFAQAPVTAALAGAGAGVAIGASTIAAARAIRPAVTNVSQSQSGASATGGSGGLASGGSNFNSSSNTAQGGSNTNTNTNSAQGGAGGFNSNTNLAQGGAGGFNSNVNSAQGGAGGFATGGVATATGGSANNSQSNFQSQLNFPSPFGF
jgi:hypothetical protein